MGDQHDKAVNRIKAILRGVGCEVKENYWGEAGQGCWKLPLMETDKGPRQWLLDVFAIFKGRPFAVEVDGVEPGQGHTGRGKVKDTFRDKFLLDNFGLVTFRFPTTYLVGKRALKDDRLFLEEMRLV